MFLIREMHCDGARPEMGEEQAKRVTVYESSSLKLILDEWGTVSTRGTRSQVEDNVMTPIVSGHDITKLLMSSNNHT